MEQSRFYAATMIHVL